MSVFNILELCGDFLFDFVLPLKERAERTKRVTVEELSLFPKEHELFGETVTTILDYREPAVRDAIQALKYDNSKSAAKLLGGALADFLAEEIAHAQLETSRSLYLVPMPLHESRMRTRI